MKKIVLGTLLLLTTSIYAEYTKPAIPDLRRQPVAARSLVIEPNWWKAADYEWQIGYEGAATNSSGTLGQNVMTGGYWFNESWGLDVYFGYTKAANGNTESVQDVTTTTTVPNTKVTTTDYRVGVNTPKTLALAAGVKYRVYQSDWFQLNIGLIAAFSPGGKADYLAGTKTETYADAADANNKTVVETGFGTVSADTSMHTSVGPRLGTEFYIKWFPHLAVGFATGILTSLAGDTTTTTDTVTRTYTVVNGVEQAPSTSATTHKVETTKPGFRATTFGLGGTTFNLMGTFSIRYVF